jgi:signal transduction histidine kinase
VAALGFPPRTIGGGLVWAILGLGMGIGVVYSVLKVETPGVVFWTVLWAGLIGFLMGRGSELHPMRLEGEPEDSARSIPTDLDRKPMDLGGTGDADHPNASPFSGELRERRRIAAVLHDDLQQTLVAARLALEAGASPDCLDTLMVAAIDTTRSLAHSLQPEDGGDLGAALRRQLAWSARWHRLQVADEVGPSVDVGAEVTRLVVAAVGELLFNAARHAPGASVRLRMEVEPKWVFVDVIDSGPGIDLQTVSLRGGLGAARRGLRALGGELDLANEPGAGLRVTLCLPRGDEHQRGSLS